MDIKELVLNSIWNLHGQLKDYDKHYSNVRVTLCSFIIIVAGYVGSFFLKIHDPTAYKENIVVVFIPISILLVNVFLSNWLVRKTVDCISDANKLETLAEQIISGKLPVTHDSINNFKFPIRSKTLSGIDIISPKEFYYDEIGNLLFSFFYFLSVFIGVVKFWTTPPYPNILLTCIIIVFFGANLWFIKLTLTCEGAKKRQAERK